MTNLENSSGQPTYKSPLRLLEELGIETPEEIDVEAIAQYCNATVRYRGLTGCEARLIGTGEEAIITINSKASRPRQRFSVGHELGHWMRDRGKIGYSCTLNDLTGRWTHKTDPESLANKYSADLLLPRYLFEPLVKDEEITFDTVAWLTERFETSGTATAIRLVEYGSYPSMLVCMSPERRMWFVKNRLVPKEIWPNLTLGKGAIAHKLLKSEAIKSKEPIEVDADNWIEHPDSSKYLLLEHSKKVTPELVLSLLWWENEQQIIDLDEDD